MLSQKLTWFTLTTSSGRPQVPWGHLVSMALEGLTFCSILGLTNHCSNCKAMTDLACLHGDLCSHTTCPRLLDSTTVIWGGVTHPDTLGF